MATFSISGNTTVASEIVYIINLTTSQGNPIPDMTITDGSGNYTFSGLTNGTYLLYTAGNQNVKQQVIISGASFTNVNFSS